MFQQKFKLDLINILSFIGAMLFQLALNNRAMQSLIHHQCTVNIFFWLEFIVRLPIFDPASKLIGLDDYESVAFQHDFIKRLIKQIESGQSLIVEKSASTGTTTCLILTTLWFLLFRPKSCFAIVSPALRSKKFRTNLNWILKCFKMITSCLPYYLIPDGGFWFNENRDEHYYFSIGNRQTGSVIYGMPSTQPINLDRLFSYSKDAVYKAAFFDEFAFHQNADYSWHSLDNTDVPRFAISCANGTSNLFYELATKSDYDKYVMHWLLNPCYTKQWYEEMCQQYAPEWIEQFLNINYAFKYKPQTASLKTKTESAVTKPPKSRMDIPAHQPSQHPTIPSPPAGEGGRSPDEGYNNTNMMDIPAHQPEDIIKEDLLISLRSLINETMSSGTTNPDPIEAKIPTYPRRKPHRNPQKLQQPSSYKQVMAGYATATYRLSNPQETPKFSFQQKQSIAKMENLRRTASSQHHRHLYSLKEAVEIVNQFANFKVNNLSSKVFTENTIYSFTVKMGSQAREVESIISKTKATLIQQGQTEAPTLQLCKQPDESGFPTMSSPAKAKTL